MRTARPLTVLVAGALTASLAGLSSVSATTLPTVPPTHPSEVAPNRSTPSPHSASTADRVRAARALGRVGPAGIAAGTVTLEVHTRGGRAATGDVGTRMRELGLSTRADLARLGYLSITVPLDEAARTSARLTALPGVTEVTRAIERHELVTPNDPQYPFQAPSFDAVHAPTAWDTSTGTGVVIAVIDGGFDVTHPDLVGKISSTRDVVSAGSNVADPSTISVPGHGTATASVAAAATDNGVGMAGAAPAAQLMLVKVSNSAGKIYSDKVAAGIVYAVDHGADVVSISLGAPGADPVEVAAVAYARNHGVVVVAAAGNTPTTAKNYPAADPGVVSVGATTQDGTARAAFSTFGSWVTVGAPGESITVAVPASVDPSGYAVWDGTSFSAPLVAGEAAILLSHRRTTPATLIATTIAAHTGAASLGFGHGLVQFDTAVLALSDDTVLTTPVASAALTGVTPVSATSGAPQVRFDVVGTAISTIVATSGGIASTTLPTYGLSGTVSVRATGCVASLCAAHGSAVPVTAANSAPILTAPVDGTDVGLSFAASATAPGGGVRFLVDGTIPIAFDGSAPYSLTIDTAAIANGDHSLTAVLCDAAGSTCDTAQPSNAITIHVMRLRPTSAIAPSPFSPNGDRRRDTTTLRYTLEQTQSAVVRVYSSAAALVRGPISLGADKAAGGYAWVWNGRANGGARVANGAYRVELSTSHTTGAGTPSASTVAGLVSATVRVDLSAPRVVSVSASPSTFFPFKDGYRDTTSLGASVAEPLSAYSVTVTTSRGRLVRTLTGAAHGTGRISLAWNGRNRAGTMMAAGSYRFRIMAQDVAGNRKLSTTGSVTLSAKRLVWRSTSTRVTAYASYTNYYEGSCSKVFKGVHNWVGSVGYWSNYLCSSGPDETFDIAAARHQYRLPVAVAYGSVRLHAYGTEGAAGYGDTGALIYYDRSGALSDVGASLGTSLAWHAAPAVTSSGYLIGGRTIAWLTGTAGGSWYDVKTFQISWRYAVLL